MSCADLRWNELISVISRLQSLNISDEDLCNIYFNERYDILNKNPVLIARHFQFRGEVFFRTIVFDGSFGKTNYYAIGIEFQVRGSTQIHYFLWILNRQK